MKFIGVLNTKGGTGKTTLTTCLAVRAAKEFRVAVLDLDPQSSYAEWYVRRGSPNNPDLLRNADRASDAAEGLRLTSPYDFIFLDGPPGALLITEDAIKTSDLVIIPIRASGLDLGASRDCIQLCQENRTAHLAVINSKGPHDKKLVEQAWDILRSWKVPVAETAISHRTQYINAITTGLTGPEKDREAAKEIDALWSEVLLSLRPSTPTRGKVRARA